MWKGSDGHDIFAQCEIRQRRARAAQKEKNTNMSSIAPVRYYETHCGRVAALDAACAVGGAPRTVCQYESSRVLLRVDGPQALIQSLFGLLHLDVRLPAPTSVLLHGVEGCPAADGNTCPYLFGCPRNSFSRRTCSVDGDPQLHAAPGCPAIMPHDPYQRTSGLSSFRMLFILRFALLGVHM